MTEQQTRFSTLKVTFSTLQVGSLLRHLQLMMMRLFQTEPKGAWASFKRNNW